MFPALTAFMSVLLLLELPTVAYGRADFILTCGGSQYLMSPHLYMAPIDSNQFTQIPIITNGVPKDVTYDPIDDQIYWIESDQRSEVRRNGDRICTVTTKIFRGDFDGGIKSECLVNDLVDIDRSVALKDDCQSLTSSSLEIDIVSRHIYWVAIGIGGFPELKRVTLNGTDTVSRAAASYHPITNTNLYLDSINRNIYWSHSFPDAHTKSMDGINIIDLIDTIGISGIAVDSKDSKLFATLSRGPDLVQITNLEDDNYNVLYNDADHTNQCPRNPVLYGNDIYWIMEEAESNKRNVYKMSKSGDDEAVKIDVGFDVQCLYIHQREDSRPTSAVSHEPSKIILKATQSAPSVFDSTTLAVDANNPQSTSNYDHATSTIEHVKLTSLSIKKSILVYTGFGLLALLVVVLCVLFTMNLRKVDSNDVETNRQAKENVYDPDSVARCSYFSATEIDRKQLKIGRQVGSGNFGVVYEGVLFDENGNETLVAVKLLKGGATSEMKKRFLDEIKLHLEIGSHPNILSIAGCITRDDPYCMVTEFMKYGDLLRFLWKCNKTEYTLANNIYDLKDVNKLYIAHQIALGMEYLSTKRYYHGDLAARNILVDEDLGIQICDFGMADDIYMEGYKRLEPERKRPIKWVSLETNISGKCTIESDVWSFGILLYEIYTLGGIPYPTLGCHEVIARLKTGHRMDKPENCPDDIYQIMRQCWLECSSERPTFKYLVRSLGEMLERGSSNRQRSVSPCSESDASVCDSSDIESYDPSGCYSPRTRDRGCSVCDSPGGISVNNEVFRPQTPYKNIGSLQKENKFIYLLPNETNRDRVTSGEPDEHNLWKHLTGEKTSNRNPSVEFVPDMSAAHIDRSHKPHSVVIRLGSESHESHS